ncbi:hypothetical protein GQ600_7218 [Phytophthora cactorum]|nr:hypothetical protein GQ600_7218 [Phytophthora cactorum]
MDGGKTATSSYSTKLPPSIPSARPPAERVSLIPSLLHRQYRSCGLALRLGLCQCHCWYPTSCDRWVKKRMSSVKTIWSVPRFWTWSWCESSPSEIAGQKARRLTRCPWLLQASPEADKS